MITNGFEHLSLYPRNAVPTIKMAEPPELILDQVPNSFVTDSYKHALIVVLLGELRQVVFH